MISQHGELSVFYFLVATGSVGFVEWGENYCCYQKYGYVTKTLNKSHLPTDFSPEIILIS